MAKVLANKDKLKLIFSSLFARKMPYVIFNHTEDLKDTLLFTNIPIESAIMYEKDADHYIHLVILRDEEFLNWFYDAFKIFRTVQHILDARKFLAALNKEKHVYENVKVSVKNNEIILSGQTGTHVCGLIVDQDIVEAYTNMYRQASGVLEWKENKDLTEEELSQAFTITDVEVCDDNIYNTKSISKYRVALLPGSDTISTKEVAKITSAPCCVKLLTQLNNEALRVKYIYNSDIIYVESICPALLWFKRTTSPVNDRKDNHGNTTTAQL